MTEQELNEIAQKLLKADTAYHNTGHPIIADQEYDALQATLKANDPKHPYFEKIGDKPSPLWEKATHNIFMGSLEKVHTEKDFLKWADKHKGETFVIQPKIDGLSLSQKFNNGVFIQAITRGDGAAGENITPNAKKMGGFVEAPSPILKEFEMGDEFSVRCEIILNKKDLDRINSVSEKPYQNCRNAASGISRRLDGKFCQYLSMIHYDVKMGDFPINENDKIEFLKRIGLKTVPYVVGNVEKMIEVYKEFKEKRNALPFGIDGVVIKINSWGKQKELGVVNGRPKGQIAWKFDPPSAATVLREVTWEVGRTGVITPLGHLDPVEIDGSIISKVTLCNVAEIGRLKIGTGDLVTITKQGDIIPKLISVIEHKNIPVIIPTKCPACKSVLENNGIQLFCTNDICSAKSFQRILNFIKVVKIDNFGEALVEKFYDMGVIRSIADIFKLKKEDISTLEGWGEKSADTIISNINDRRKMAPAIFLASMGIPTLSDKTAEDLIKTFKTIDRIQKATIEEISAIKGYSTVSATSIVSGLKAYDAQISEVLKHVELQSQTVGGKLSGMSFCFTGEMSQPRSFFQGLVTKHGGKNDSGVTKTTTYLVCNENKGSSKSKKAEQYGSKTINEQAFMSLVGEIVIQSKPKIKTNSLFEE